MATIPGSTFDDLIIGTDRGDFIDAGAGDDTILAVSGNDLVVGGDGDDTICAAAGNDTLIGGSGNDTFVFTSGGGKDVVLDFSNGDILHIPKTINGLAVITPADLANNVTSVKGNAVIDLGNGDSITLVGIKAEDVQANPSGHIVIV